MWTRMLMSFNNFNDSQKDNPCIVSRTSGKKTVANVRAGIKHST